MGFAERSWAQHNNTNHNQYNKNDHHTAGDYRPAVAAAADQSTRTTDPAQPAVNVLHSAQATGPPQWWPQRDATGYRIVNPSARLCGSPAGDSNGTNLQRSNSPLRDARWLLPLPMRSIQWHLCSFRLVHPKVRGGGVGSR